MRDWKSIELPDLMKDMEKDKRGYVVPFVVYRDENNLPYFAVNDEKKTLQAIREDLCPICGKVCGEDKWLIGGPKSAFHEYGCYIDIPTHKQCGEYALKVCPYLAVSINIKRFDPSRVKGALDTLILVDPSQSEDRVPFFVFSKISGYEVQQRGIYRYVHPYKPFLEVEYWNDGIQVNISQEDIDKYVNS